MSHDIESVPLCFECADKNDTWFLAVASRCLCLSYLYLVCLERFRNEYGLLCHWHTYLVLFTCSLIVFEVCLVKAHSNVVILPAVAHQETTSLLL